MKFSIFLIWGRSKREIMQPEDVCSPSRRANKATSSRQRQDGYCEVSKTNRRKINRKIPLLPQDQDFGWVSQVAASKSLDIFHIDLETAFLQGQSSGVNRYDVFQLPPGAGRLRCVAAGLEKLAYGVNGAPRRWWNILDTALRSYGMVPTRADRCCYALYSNHTCKQNWNKTCSTQGHGTKDISLESRARSEGDAAFEKTLDSIEGSPATGNSVAGIVNLIVDDLFGTGGTEMEQRVLAGLKKGFPSWFRRLEWCVFHRTEMS